MSVANPSSISFTTNAEASAADQRRYAEALQASEGNQRRQVGGGAKNKRDDPILFDFLRLLSKVTSNTLPFLLSFMTNTLQSTAVATSDLAAEL